MPEARPGFQIGEILWVDLPLRIPPGHEQLGRRPVVVVGLPEAVQTLPFRLLIVVPLTRTRRQGPLFPVLTAGTGGLPADSTALLSQVLALDVRRVVGRIGQLTATEYAPIRAGLRRMFGFPTDPETPAVDTEENASEGT